jgi:hypothetical protein
MKPTAFRYEVNLRVSLTKREVEVLTAVCERHYDSAVRALSKPGKDAVINACRTGLLGGFAVTDAVFTYRQLDTLAKGLEGARTDEEVALYATVKKLMKLVTEERMRIDRNELTAPTLWAGVTT